MHHSVRASGEKFLGNTSQSVWEFSKWHQNLVVFDSIFHCHAEFVFFRDGVC